MSERGGDRPTGARRRVADLLRGLRERTGLSTPGLARELKAATGGRWSQPKVWRIENAEQGVTIAEALAWARLCGASPATLALVEEAAGEALAETRAWRRELAAGYASLQAAVGDLERAAHRILMMQHSLVPGLLQTRAYALAVFERVGAGHEREAAADARMSRQAVLREPGPPERYEFLITEGALRWRPGPPALLADQLDHLVTAAELPSVRLGVIPFSAEAPAIYESFDVYELPRGERLVTIEEPSRELHLRDPEEVAQYSDLFALLQSVAVTGDALRELLDRIRAEILA